MAQRVKNLPAMLETQVQSQGQKDSWVGKIPWRKDRLPIPVFMGFLGGSDSKESSSNAGEPEFNHWVGKIPWRKAWQLTPVFLSGESPWTEEPGRLQSMRLKRVGHN